jgi:Zn-dependent protease/predicted transcriptional regulator
VTGRVNGVAIARILGFEVRLHISWLFIIAIITVTVAERLTDFQSQVTAPVSWGIGLAGSVGFMLTVVAHELAHAVLARRDGREGNVVVVHSSLARGRDRSRALDGGGDAIAGPPTSALTGRRVRPGLRLFTLDPAWAPVADLLAIIGALDLVLAAVSIVPAFPLDGGRIVRAAAWARTGNQRSGTRIAGSVGRWTGRAFLVIGLVLILTEDTFDGIMTGLVGWFLMASARSVDRWLVLDDLVQGIQVGEAMEKDLETLSPQLTLDTFATSILDGTVGPALPVLRGDAVVGIVGAAQVRAVPQRSWPTTRSEDVMVGGETMPSASPGDSVADALERLRISHLDGLPVLDGTVLRGMLTRRSIAVALHARAEARGQAL